MLTVRRWLTRAIVLSLVFGTTFAQTPPIAPVATPSITPVERSTPSLSVSPNAVEHVVELTGQLDQRLLTTVYWCLGTLVTVFVILIGYNWFVNFRVHERDFRELKNDIATGLDMAVDKIQTAAKTAREESNTQLRKSAESYVDSKMSDVRQAITALRTEVARLEAANLEREVDMWLAKKVYSNALLVHLEYLHNVQKRGADWMVQQGLDKLETILRRAVHEKPGLRPDADQIAALSRFLDSAAKENPALVNTLRSLVEELCRLPAE